MSSRHCLVNWLRLVHFFLNRKCCTHLPKVSCIITPKQSYTNRSYYIRSMHSLFWRKWTFCHFNRTSNKMKNNHSLPISFVVFFSSFSLFAFQIESNHNAFARHRIQTIFFDRCTDTYVQAMLLKNIICSLCFLMSFRFFTISPFHIRYFYTSFVWLILILLLESVAESSCRSLQQIITNYTRGVPNCLNIVTLCLFLSFFFLFFIFSINHPPLLHSFFRWIKRVLAATKASERMWNRKSICCEKNKSTLYGCIEQNTYVYNTHLSSSSSLLLFVPF